MAKFRMVRTEFWRDAMTLEEMSPEDKYFYIYLLTNPKTTQIGIFRITKKEMAFELGYSLESVQALMERFIKHHRLIRYNPKTRELAIKNWGKFNLQKGGKPVMDCIKNELKEVEDTSLISYVSEAIPKEEISHLFESFCQHDAEMKMSHQVEHDPYPHTECEEVEETHIASETKPEQEEKAVKQNADNHPGIEDQSKIQNSNDVQEIIEFWDNNGFGLSNVNAKEQLLSWLDDSSFLQPKEIVLKALAIACANNKRRLNYVVGILRNWENESLLSIEEIDSYQEDQSPVHKQKQTEAIPAGRAIPSEFVFDITAGEDG
ncbi:primosome, DnaD subunit [Bacillus sp. SA1-12]|uniref:DnaD domain protein n=1 Tax=Bacillus sp. SA1-12 TaxID=1455638 RepID=UPI0006256168|nr:DnaD domain protein [Bacillus sp. SA1-12]KKI92110.1 primosome, DnaD subunit [Bacillus sp. SA1-12]